MILGPEGKPVHTGPELACLSWLVNEGFNNLAANMTATDRFPRVVDPFGRPAYGDSPRIGRTVGVRKPRG